MRPDGDVDDITAGYNPAVFVCYAGLAMPRRARKPLIPSRQQVAELQLFCRSHQLQGFCDLPPDRVRLIDRSARRFREMIVAKQMASGGNVS